MSCCTRLRVSMSPWCSQHVAGAAALVTAVSFCSLQLAQTTCTGHNAIRRPTRGALPASCSEFNDLWS